MHRRRIVVLFSFAILFVIHTICPRSVRAGEIVINEIHYDQNVKTEKVEFIELYNRGGEVVDLEGWSFTAGVDFVFGSGVTIGPGGYVVVAQDVADFQAKYGFAPFGPWVGKLDNDGETITLRDSVGQVEDQVDYQLGFPWPTVGGSPDFSLAPVSSIELVNPELDNNLGGSWRASLATASSGQVLMPEGSSWEYFKGTSEASNPTTAWRQPGFSETGWLAGTAPIGYGEAFLATSLSDMQGNYTAVFFRKTFVVEDPSQLASLTLEVMYDDGFKAWINGVSVIDNEANMPAGEVAYGGTAVQAIENVQFVKFPLNNPASFLVPGTNVIAIQAHNSSLGSSTDFFLDARLTAALVGQSTGVGPSPGRRNSVYATNTPPQIRQVEHSPKEPRSGDMVTITAKATDPDGVASVLLEYQLVDPGNYIEISDLAYTNTWTSVDMKDNGVGGDAVAGDAIYTVQMPASLQRHRRLIRYRITAGDAGGWSVRVPYPDDPQPNFACFVYDGVPAWQGSVQPGVQPVLTVPTSEMSRLPVYHLISKRSEVEDCTWFSRYAGDQYNWTGTIVYDGEVYDHIHMRARGGVWRYSMVKNMWKFRFSRGHEFQARDNWGRTFATKWTRLNLGASIQQGDFNHRGEQGMFESVGFRLFNLAGLEAPHTSFITLRIIDEAEESFANNQFEGDFWGVYLVTEQIEGRFLDEHGLPDGNLYKMESGYGPTGAAGELKNQGPDQVDDYSDLINFRSTIRTAPSDQWWRDHFDLDRYYNYYTIVQAIHHYDICCGKNYFYLFNPVTGKMQLYPWDLDLTWADNMYEANDGGTDEIYDAGQIFSRSAFNLELRNSVREILDLLYNEDQAWRLIDEYAGLLQGPKTGPTVLDADRATWDYNPKMVSSTYTPNPSNKAGQGRFYQFPGESATNAALRGSFDACVQLMKFYVSRRIRATTYPSGTPLAVWELDTQIPATPVLMYTGPGGFPINSLTFRVANYSGTSPFAALKWRIGEITPPDAPAYNLEESNKYEIEPVWESAEIANQNSLDIQIPADVVRAGSTYRVRCRFKDTTGRWSHWSQPVEFAAGQPFSAPLLLAYLRITEVMYNAPAGSDFDFVELHNTSADTTLDLGGAKFTKGIDYLFPQTTHVPPGGYLLVIKTNESAFRARYGLSTNVSVAGPYSGNLANEGELVTLRTSAGGTDIASFTYNDGRGWPLPADGTGHSLIPLVLADQADGALNYGGNWRASAYLGGSPGEADPAPSNFIVLNEITAHTDFPAPPPLDSNDWIELHNRGGSDFTFGSGWYLSDDGNPTNLTKWMIPPGTVIQAGGFVSFDEQTGFHHPTNIGFGLNKGGEQVFLSYLAGTGEDRVVDSVSFKGQENDWSLAHCPDGGLYWYSLTPRTQDSANAVPGLHVAISEIMYHPRDIGGLDNTQEEFIEIFNPTASPVSLFDTNGAWRLDGGVQFTLPTGVSLEPMSYLLVVSFNPFDTAQATAFRAAYGLPSPGPLLLGPYSGQLANSSERVALEKPQAPDQPGDSISWVIVDEVIYADRLPWSVGADGIGPSLQRLDFLQHGCDPANWAAAAPLPGGAYAGGLAPTITTQPTPLAQVLPAGSTLTYSVVATGSEPFSYQWLLNGSPLAYATNAMLTIDFTLPADSGSYSVVVMNSAGSAVSVPVSLSITTPPRILAQPQGVTVRPGANVSLVVTATGAGPLSYFWRHNDVLITDVTGPVLAIDNVQAEHEGTYVVTVMDTNGIVVSDPARLVVLINPSVLVPPLSQSMVVGGEVTFSVVTAGTLPMGYRWRKGFATVKSEALNAHVSYLTLTNVQLSNAANYSVVLTNQALYQPGVLSSNATLTVLQDSDRDSMPDTWETNHGLNPNDPTDAGLDPDGDGLTNVQEYLADTDPNDPNSYLRIESIETDFAMTGTVRLSFPAAAYRTYSVQYRDALGPGPWSQLVDVAAVPTNRLMEVYDQPSIVTSKRFYRLVTPRVKIP